MTNREIDKEISEKIFKIKTHYNALAQLCVPTTEEFPDRVDWEDCPDYSSDMNDAMEVVEKLHSSGWDVQLFKDVLLVNRWRCTFQRGEHGVFVSVCDESLPKAICKAALMTVGK